MGLQRLLPQQLQWGPIIPKNVLASLGQGHPRTPDYYDLATRRELHVFVADEMMKGHRAELPADFAEHYAGAFSLDAFMMFQKHLGKMTFPVIMRKDPQHTCGAFQRADMGPVRGDLWKIKPEFIVALDNWKENGDTFQRELVSVAIPTRDKFEREFAVVNEGGAVRVKSLKTGRSVVEKGNFKTGTEFVYGEWHKPAIIQAFMYVARPEKWLWEVHSDPDFKSMRMKRSSDRNPDLDTNPGLLHVRPHFHFKEVNGQSKSQPHQPFYKPHVQVRPDLPELKGELLKKFLTHPEYMERLRVRQEEAAEAAKLNGSNSK